MTYEEISTMVAEIGLPYAYYQFPGDTERKPPFVCFLFLDSDDLYADNENYVGIRRLYVELYTDEKRIDLEQTVERVLKSHGLTYTYTETYISQEKMWQSTYEMEVIINA